MAEQSRNELATNVLKNRYWQHLINEALKKNAFAVPVHCAFGHEAIAVALSSMMEPLDRLVLTHRNMAYNLARFGALKPVWDEYMNLPSGGGGGQLGSMNLSDPKIGVEYSSSILGNNMPVACGMALAHQMQKRDGIVTVLTGDGAMEEGTLYESFDMARSQNLPWMLVIENNHFAMSSTIEDRRSPIDVSSLCKAFNIPYYAFTDNDVFAYASSLKDIRSTMLSDKTPAVIEVDLKNVYRHAGATPGWPTDPMSIDFNEGLQFEESTYDPVYVLKQNLSAEEYAELESTVLAEQWSL